MSHYCRFCGKPLRWWKPRTLIARLYETCSVSHAAKLIERDVIHPTGEAG